MSYLTYYICLFSPKDSSKAERSQGGRSVRRPASVPSKKPSTIDLLAKEEEYKCINAELEAKTAELVRQAEQVMVSVPYVCYDFFNFLFELYFVYLLLYFRTTKTSAVDDVAVLKDCVDFSLLEDGDTHVNLMEDIMRCVGDEMGSDAQIRFLKAKLCVKQEEFNRLSYECNIKDNANSSLSTKHKGGRGGSSRTTEDHNFQQTQIEKHRALAEVSNRKGDGLQQQVTALQKEIGGLKRAQKQAATNHSAIEVRLNRGLEEVERSKTQLTKLKTQQTRIIKKCETLKAKNKKLEKQKVKAAKMLSFTEEGFMKALDWGKS
uniref:Testis expressed 9 n=1 Tax=Oncorhynchus tshawytscha TaxID=74940 RepID=A0A8C8F0D2_ONCTS